MSAGQNQTTRCPVCDWPMAATVQEGCVPGNCSYRPDEGSAEWRRIKARRAALTAEAINDGR